MRIGFIGAGHIGSTLARMFARAGHEVGVSNSREPETLQELAEELGAKAHAGSSVEIADFGEIIVVSVPFGHYHLVPAAESSGKIVIDTNNYYPERDGRFEEIDEGTTTSSELLQIHLSGAKVVKAFNTINWRILREAPREEGDPERVAVPIAGDDAEAKRMVMSLIESLGFDVVDVGALSEGRRVQPGSAVFGKALSADDVRGALGL